MEIEEVKKLGWNLDGYWANRGLYSINEKSKFQLIEHNGDWGILDPYSKGFNPIYCNMSLDNIKKFTELVKLFEDMFDKPKEYTLFQYIETEINMQDFIKEMKDRS